jgi:MFS transporter, ACS family, D-galactonate transporter
MNTTLQPAVGRVRYQMLALVFMNVVINYIDRSNISVAGAAMSKDLNLSSVELGYIFSAFGWTYALLQVPGGFIADRFAPRVLYAVCLITWSVATVLQGFARSFALLFGLRLATGMFEAPSYPINNRIVTNWFPENERASAIAMYVSGQFIGLAMLTPLLALIQAYAGWQGLFLATGALGIVWGVIWYLAYRDPLDHPRVSESELAYIEAGGGLTDGRQKAKSALWTWESAQQVLTNRTLWGVYIGQFCVNAMLWFFMTWFPTYLVKYRGLDFIKSGYLASVPFLAACAGLLLSGFLSDRWVRQGWSVSRARKTPIIAGMLLSTVIIAANYTNDTALVIFFMSLAFFGCGMSLITWIFVSLLSPKHLVGLTGGIFNFMGNLTSIVVPIVIGYLVQSGDFRPALVFIGVIGLIGAFSYSFIVGEIKRIPSSPVAEIRE